VVARASGPRWTEAEKAEAVARVSAGESVHAVARSLGTQPSTVRDWRVRLGADPQKKDPDFRALVLRYLKESLEAGERVLGQTRNQAWLDKQPAGELAVFLGVVFDKAARILAALPGQSPPGLPAPSPGEPDAEPRAFRAE
jgi:transposase-like protein